MRGHLQASSEIARALRGPPLAELTIQDGDAHGGMRLGRVREQQEDAKEHSSREASGECDAPREAGRRAEKTLPVFGTWRAPPPRRAYAAIERWSAGLAEPSLPAERLMESIQAIALLPGLSTRDLQDLPGLQSGGKSNISVNLHSARW